MKYEVKYITYNEGLECKNKEIVDAESCVDALEQVTKMHTKNYAYCDVTSVKKIEGKRMKVYLVWCGDNGGYEETLEQVFLYREAAEKYINSVDECLQSMYRIEERIVCKEKN